jgi:nucleotide-binding universal stress UspA family protein
VRVVQDKIAHALIEQAGQKGLIVVGSRGLDVIDRFVLGSVSITVTLHASCPVLIVKEAGEQLLAQEAAKLEKSGYRVRQFPCVRPAAEEIMKVVNREHPDLIVTGAKRRSAVARFLQGSVSIKIVQRSDCSVLVAR